MSSVRRSSIRALIVSLSFGIGFWVLASFAGTMLDPARAQPWTTSLMWSLLASALIAPALLMAYHHARTTGGQTTGARTVGARARKARKANADGPKSFIDETPPVGQTPSIEEEPAIGQQATLWPEPERSEADPAPEASDGWPYVREDAPQREDTRRTVAA